MFEMQRSHSCGIPSGGEVMTLVSARRTAASRLGLTFAAAGLADHFLGHGEHSFCRMRVSGLVVIEDDMD